MSFVQLHGVRPREALDRAALVLAFAVGCFGTVLLKLLGAHILLTALFPVGVLLAYVLLCILARSVTLEPDSVGDNCYYLGFLFTLTSLAVTLYQIRDLSAPGAGPDGAPDAGGGVLAADVIPLVISGFGVALTSTIMGVFLRVMLMQLRPDIVARDREARRDLNQGARDFHVAVTQATRRMKDIALESVQQVAERNARISDLTDEHAARLSELSGRHATQSEELLAWQARAYEEHLAAFAARLSEEVVGRLAAEGARAAETLASGTATLAQAVSEAAQAQQDGAARMRAAQEALEASLARWSEALDRASALAATQSESLAAAGRSQQEALAAASRALVSEAEALARALGDQVGAMTATLRSQADALAAARPAPASHAADPDAPIGVPSPSPEPPPDDPAARSRLARWFLGGEDQPGAVP